MHEDEWAKVPRFVGMMLLASGIAVMAISWGLTLYWQWEGGLSSVVRPYLSAAPLFGLTLFVFGVLIFLGGRRLWIWRPSKL